MSFAERVSAGQARLGSLWTLQGYVPFQYDTTNHKLWAYDGAWKGVVLA
jgi:hypothetical protein